MKSILLLIIGGLLFVIVVNVTRDHDPQVPDHFTADSTSPILRRLATVQCQRQVLARLKAPATARFQPDAQDADRDSEGVYTSVSYVDAQNGFGALIRTKYTCVLRHLGDAHWSVVKLTTE